VKVDCQHHDGRNGLDLMCDGMQTEPWENLLPKLSRRPHRRVEEGYEVDPSARPFCWRNHAKLEEDVQNVILKVAYSEINKDSDESSYHGHP
jgi:hypothetical protein